MQCTLGDEREASLQRAPVAAAMAARIPGFADALLVGEVKLRTDARDRARVEAQLREKSIRLPFAGRVIRTPCK